jgi:hypothetical protein
MPTVRTNFIFIPNSYVNLEACMSTLICFIFFFFISNLNLLIIEFAYLFFKLFSEHLFNYEVSSMKIWSYCNFVYTLIRLSCRAKKLLLRDCTKNIINAI